MEALLYTGFAIALFCLGVSAGAILENRLMKTRIESRQQVTEVIEEIEKIKPLLISLTEQVEREYNSCTPVMYAEQDPDQTMELPITKEATWQKEQNH